MVKNSKKNEKITRRKEPEQENERTSKTCVNKPPTAFPARNPGVRRDPWNPWNTFLVAPLSLHRSSWDFLQATSRTGDTPHHSATRRRCYSIERQFPHAQSRVPGRVQCRRKHPMWWSIGPVDVQHSSIAAQLWSLSKKKPEQRTVFILWAPRPTAWR